MHRRGFRLRWVVLSAFVVFAFFLLVSLAAGRYEVVGDGLSAVFPSAGPPTSTPAITAVEPKNSPTTLSPVVSSSPASRLTPVATPGAATPTPPTPAVDLLYPVDKQTSIPASYVPPDLVALTTIRTTTANQKVRSIILRDLEKMVADAKTMGYELVVSSAYRSYNEQESVHAYWQRTLGKTEADRVSAQAGYSEHQLGTTVDLTSASVGFELEERFGSTPEGRWLKENAHRYGFVISYPAGKEAVTGYAYEPWHLRYVGLDHATAIYQRGMALAEYLRSRR